MKTQTKTRNLVAVALLIAGSVAILPVAQAREISSDGPQEIRQLLGQVKAEAITLDQDADQLAVWSRNHQTDWRTHADKLNLIVDHINKAGQLLAQLNQAREKASPWQLEAIDRIQPLLQGLADNTEATVAHFNDNRHNIHFPAYHQYARTNADLANQLAILVTDYVDFGEHEVESQRLQQKLAMTAS